MNHPFQRLKDLLEHLNGCSTQRPAWLKREIPGWVWGLWWGLLLAVIALFCGQGSKFIYIDF